MREKDYIEKWFCHDSDDFGFDVVDGDESILRDRFDLFFMVTCEVVSELEF